MDILFIIYVSVNGFDPQKLKLGLYMLCGTGVLLISAPVLLHKLIFDKDGCTVQFFKYKRTYRWDELKIKRIERKKSKEWVFFSVKEVKKSTTSDPFTYCVFRHPFTSFYVVLKDMKLNGENFERPYQDTDNLYDKTMFLEKMKEWHVELTEE